MYLLFSFIFIFCLQIQAQREPSAYCFKFTWLGPMYDENSKQVNCSEYKNAPCLEPFVFSPFLPNTTDLWLQETSRNQYTCLLSPGYVCIKHTFTYNNAVINSTHFCGKMVEDKTSAVTSNCFSQKVDGHTIESCACQSDRGMRPCNSAKVNQYSILFLLLLLLKQIF